MEPAIRKDERVLVFGWAYLFRKPKKGDLVVLRDPRSPERRLLKRVEKVRGEEVWVAGDNPRHSSDSKQFGPIKKSEVLGKAVFSYKKKN